MIEYIAISAIVAVAVWRYFRTGSGLEYLPGPRPLPLVGNALQIEARMPPLTLDKWYKQYGPVYKVHFPEGAVVVVAGYDSVKEVLVTRGQDFAGRPNGYRDYLLCRFSAIYANQPGKRFTALRKLLFSFSKPYGSDMDHIESIASEIANDLFTCCRHTNGEAFDPITVLENATVKFTLLMMCGDYLEDEHKLVTLTREFNQTVPHLLSQSVQGMLLDSFPWLRVFGLSTYKMGVRCYDIIEEMWEILQERQRMDPGKETFARILHDHVEGTEPVGEVNPKLKSLNLDDAKTTATLINFAGGSTTALALYGIFKALLHFPEIQEKAYREIIKVLKINQQVTLQDRASLPYVCAIVKEAERFFSVAPLGLPHLSVADTQIQGMPIPKNTRILTSLWSVHHDEAFWGDPYNFRPERFLDETGAMLQLDHENLHHVFGFGAGARVCPGEALANTRMFLWLVDLVRMFKILPPDSQKLGPCDPSDAIFGAPTRLCNYKLRLVLRE